MTEAHSRINLYVKPFSFPLLSSLTNFYAILFNAFVKPLTWGGESRAADSETSEDSPCKRDTGLHNIEDEGTESLKEKGKVENLGSGEWEPFYFEGPQELKQAVRATSTEVDCILQCVEIGLSDDYAVGGGMTWACLRVKNVQAKLEHETLAEKGLLKCMYTSLSFGVEMQTFNATIERMEDTIQTWPCMLEYRQSQRREFSVSAEKPLQAVISPSVITISRDIEAFYADLLGNIMGEKERAKVMLSKVTHSTKGKSRDNSKRRRHSNSRNVKRKQVT